MALGAIGLWSTLAATSVSLSAVPPFLLVAVTLTLGGMCGLGRWREWRVPGRTFLLGIYGLFGYHFFLFMALRLAPAVEANLINYLWPLLIVVLTPVFLKGYRLSARHLVAAVMGFSGAILVVTQGRLYFSSEYTVGYLLAAGCAFVWSSYSLLTRRVPPFPTSAVGLFCLASGALSFFCHFIFESAYNPSPREWGFLFGLGLGPMGAAFFLWDAAVKNGDPRVIGSLAYLTPLLSTLFLVVGRGEKLTSFAIAAMVLIIGGAALGSLGSKPRISPQS